MIARIFLANGKHVDVECEFVVHERYTDTEGHYICRATATEKVAEFQGASGWVNVDVINEQENELLKEIKDIGEMLASHLGYGERG